MSDDISAAYSPKMYREFSAPYHVRIFGEFGCGGLHTCGPNPCHAEYVANAYSLRAIDLFDTYSHADLPNLKESFKKRAFVYLCRDGQDDPVEWFLEIMEVMVPDVVVAPLFGFFPDNHPEEIGRKLRVIAAEMRSEWIGGGSGNWPRRLADGGESHCFWSLVRLRIIDIHRYVQSVFVYLSHPVKQGGLIS